jgi:choline-sulfatase
MRIIYFDLDATRPDHLGCYGYGRNTTPYIDSVAAEAMRFDSYYCSDAPCLPSRAALISGKFGIHTGIINHGGQAADPHHPGKDRFMFNQNIINNFFFLFRNAGLYTASVSTFSERHSAYWFNAGLNEVVNIGKIGSETAGEIADAAEKWLKENAESDNWFLHVHMWDVHAPYNAPESFGNPFENEPLCDNWIDDGILEQHRKHVGPHSANELSMFSDEAPAGLPRNLGQVRTLANVKQVIDGYDTDLKYMDSQIGRLLSFLKDRKLYDDLAVIVSADHGENLGELGIYSEHATADYCTTRIPLIIKWPGMRTGKDEGLHYNIDLTRTMADLLKTEPIPDGDGLSFAETLEDGTECGRDHLIVSQCAHVCQRAVRWDDYLYIHTYHDGYHLFPDEMLFNVKKDPHELYDLAQERQNLCDHAARLLLSWEHEMMLSGKYEGDPMWTVIREGGPFNASGMLPMYLKRLEETGRKEGADELRKRHPVEAEQKKVFPHLPDAIRRVAQRH